VPVTVAAPAKVWTIFARSNTAIVGSNPTQGMDVCVRLFCLCCSVCRQRPWDGLIPSLSSPYRLCIGLRNWKSGQGSTTGL
jgi:hypothetical protein